MMILHHIRSLFAPHRPQQCPPRVYIDASSFDPNRAGVIPGEGKAVILFVLNEADSIAELVQWEKQYARGVVVIDQGSKDATPILAAAAGAVVVLQEPGISRDEALQKALAIARSFSADVDIRC